MLLQLTIDPFTFCSYKFLIFYFLSVYMLSFQTRGTRQKARVLGPVGGELNIYPLLIGPDCVYKRLGCNLQHGEFMLTRAVEAQING